GRRPRRQRPRGAPPPARGMSARRLLPLALAAAVLAPRTAAAQDSLRSQIRASQERLEQIRAEREQLQAEMEELRSRVHDIAGELVNIERQVAASTRALRELD